MEKRIVIKSIGKKNYQKVILILFGIFIVSCTFNEYKYSYVDVDVINQHIADKDQFNIRVMPYGANNPETDSLKSISFFYEFLFTLDSSEAIPKIVQFNVNLYTPNLLKQYTSQDSIHKTFSTKAQNDDISTNVSEYTLDLFDSDRPEEIVKKADGRKIEYFLRFPQHYYINISDINRYLVLKGIIILDISRKTYKINVNKKVKITYSKY